VKYSISEFLYLTFCTIKTKLFFPSSRIIRFPIDIRGKKYIDFGRGLTTGKYCRIECYPIQKNWGGVLLIGNNVQMNDFVHITAAESVKIGSNVLLASKIYISDIAHGSYKGDANDASPEMAPISRNPTTNPVVIEDNVWIGELCSILPGVHIGKGSVIGANSVVTKNIPENCIAVGNPAKVIKKFNFETKHWERI